MHRPSRCVLPGADGLELEAVLYKTAGDSTTLGMLILHPYPLLGGTMHDPTVTTIFNAAVRSGKFSTVVRYNQRGVGLSQGSKSVTGAGDIRDAQRLVQYILHEDPNPPQKLVVVGYSWGSCIAAHALEDTRVSCYVGISFPLGNWSFSGLLARAFLQPTSHFQLLQASQLPKLLVLGTKDQFTGPKAVLHASGVKLNINTGTDQQSGTKIETTAHTVEPAAPLPDASIPSQSNLVHKSTSNTTSNKSKNNTQASNAQTAPPTNSRPSAPSTVATAVTTTTTAVTDPPAAVDFAASACRQWSGPDGTGVVTHRGGSFDVWVVEGVDHFWFDLWEWMAREVVQWAIHTASE